MTATAPPPVECQILHFKHLFKLKTHHDVSKNTYQKPTSLIAISTLHGLTFVGEWNALKVIPTFKLYEETQNFSNKNLETYHHRNLVLPASPTHIDINAEQKLLAVAFIHNDVPVLQIYVIDSFLVQNMMRFPEVRLSSTGATHITDLCWNPGLPNILACCISDGSLSTYTFNSPDNFEVKSLPKESSSLCVCWSPKGKQIVVGDYNGYLTQYLPELKAVKKIPPPPGLFPKACTLCSVKWISNFQFIGVYKTQENSSTDDEEIKTCVVVINTPKNGPVQYINYDDVCFSGGTDRPVQFYFNHIPSWNLIFVSSSNSLEVAVLGLCPDNQTWVLWNLEPEEMRITLPYLPSGEAFPVGVAIDYSVPLQISIGDKSVQFPAISVMTCEGLLCIYLINFLNPAAPNVCSPANGSISLQYFTSQSITEDESSQKQTSEVVPAQDSPNSEDLSGIAYHIDQYSPQVEETVSLADATLRNAQEQLQMHSINLLNELSSAFNFETSFAKEMAPDSTNTQNIHTSNSFSQETLNESVLASKVREEKSSTSGSSEVIGVVKKSEPPKPRLEAVKKLKKRASVFENDVQEIKYLVSNINMGCDESRLHISEKFAALENISGKLKVTNSELRSDVDILRTSVIEVFANVQEIKSKLFQLTNPGYQSLTGAQDIDPISLNNLKNVQSTINYVQSQAEKASKQLEEIWFKFSQNPAALTTKVPILENVYETMVKQKKILSFLKLQTEKLEKRFTTIIHRLSRENRYISSPNDVSWSANKLLNENMSLDDLTKKALNLNSLPDAQLQPKQLASKYSREHAKRFHLSYIKQVKLQELHSTSGVIHIQSSRLQRLKKKSLITLSKNTREPDVNDEKIMPKKSEPFRVAMISPVSSDEEKSTVMNCVVSSTPLKSVEMPRFTMENTLPGEPSIIRPVTSAPSKPLFSSLTNLSTTIPRMPKLDEVKTVEVNEKIIQESIAATIKPDQSPATVVTPTTIVPVPTLMAEKTTTPSGTTMFAGKLSPATTPAFPNSLQLSFATVSSAITPTLSESTNRTLFSGVGTTISARPPVGNSASTQGPLLSNFSGGSLFSNLTSAITTAPSNSVSASVPATTFSFAFPKTESSAITVSSPPAAVSATSSIFSGKTLQTFDTIPTSHVKSSLPVFGAVRSAAVSSSSDESLFKAIATSSSTLPSFGSLTSGTTITTTTATVPEGTFVSAAFTVSSGISALAATPSTSVFGNASIFNKQASTTSSLTSTLNFGSMLSGSPSAENPSISSCIVPPTTSVTGQKGGAFSSFSFASKPPVVGTSVTITEVTNDEEKDRDKENVSVPSTNTSSLSFTSSPLFSPIRSSIASSNTVPNTVSTTATSSFSPKASTPDTTLSTAFSGTLTAPAIATPAVLSASTVGAGTFDNASSFFGNLNLGATPVTGSTSTNPPLFGKAQSVSSAPSLFSGSGANIFSQASNATAESTTADSKPLFGSGTAAPLFGQSAAAMTDSKNLFGGSSSSGNFQSNAGSPFSSGGSMFRGGSTFGGVSTTQASTFGSSSGGSVFGSNFTASFQNTSSGFGSPPTFSNNRQQQQPQPPNGSGFGSPPAFSNAFQKTGSTFPAFGSAPTFGGSPSFGTSPTKVFGQSSVNMGTFGSTVSQQPAAFDTLANESTLTFGNLAQQQQQQQPPPSSSGFGSPPSFGSTNATNNPTFGSTSSNFGTSSFSSWR